jgi:hypothetical protein
MTEEPIIRPVRAGPLAGVDPWAVEPEPFDPRIRPGLLLPTIAQLIVCTSFVALFWQVLL